MEQRRLATGAAPLPDQCWLHLSRTAEKDMTTQMAGGARNAPWPVTQNTESFSNESDGCFEMRCGDAKNCSDLILWYLLIELFIELLNSHNGENVEWCCLTNCILNIKTFHFEFWPQYAKFLSVVLISPGEAAWTSPQQRNLILSIDALYILYPPLTLNVIKLE